MNVEQLFNEGDKAFRIGRNGIDEVTITHVFNYTTHYVYRDDRGHSILGRTVCKNYFKMLEEAEKELQRRKNINKKRDLMREYERKLNKELNIENHLIIK